MKPREAFEALADIVTQTVKKPFREEPVTEVEWAVITDRVLKLAEKETTNAARTEANRS